MVDYVVGVKLLDIIMVLFNGFKDVIEINIFILVFGGFLNIVM